MSYYNQPTYNYPEEPSYTVLVCPAGYEHVLTELHSEWECPGGWYCEECEQVVVPNRLEER